MEPSLRLRGHRGTVDSVVLVLDSIAALVRRLFALSSRLPHPLRRWLGRRFALHDPWNSWPTITRRLAPKDEREGHLPAIRQFPHSCIPMMLPLGSDDVGYGIEFIEKGPGKLLLTFQHGSPLMRPGDEALKPCGIDLSCRLKRHHGLGDSTLQVTLDLIDGSHCTNPLIAPAGTL